MNTNKANSHPGMQRALRLEYVTVGYNSLEAIAAITFGLIAGSIALFGFGLDSIIESLSGMILIWRLYDHDRQSSEESEKKERYAVRFVSISFFILGAYIIFESVRKLLVLEIPNASLPGIIIASLSLIIMPILAMRKKKLGQQINSRALMADAQETIACALLSAALLLGLGLHWWIGFWQADPAAAILIALYLFKEGKENWEDEDDEESTEK